jgi:hypothetical protein
MQRTPQKGGEQFIRYGYLRMQNNSWTLRVMKANKYNNNLQSDVHYYNKGKHLPTLERN